MSVKEPILFVEINKLQFIFVAGHLDENRNFELTYTLKTPLQGVQNKQISDQALIINIIKENVYSIEKKLNFVFKEAILIINYFESSTINYTGFKKLNGSQLSKDNITYILNLLKSKINEIENQKTILHIFNSKYFLDNKEVDNLPIGLFGNMYSQELSFVLFQKSDFSNLKYIFENCNLKLKKVISKKFLEGINIINNNPEQDSFLKINLNENDTEIIYYENSALKFFQNFKFGSNLILNDISKIISLDFHTIKKILTYSNFKKINDEIDLIEKEYFDNHKYRKIRKQLILDIAKARIEEITELVIHKNINLTSFLKKKSMIYLNINDYENLKCFENYFKDSFSRDSHFNFKFTKNLDSKEIYDAANLIVQYGWKKEAVPIVQEKKSIISRIFGKIFN